MVDCYAEGPGCCYGAGGDEGEAFIAETWDAFLLRREFGREDVVEDGRSTGSGGFTAVR